MSVLCPGFIKTQIMTSDRNVPGRFGAVEGMVDGADESEFAKLAREAIAHGIDPRYVGELVREGIDGDWPYILADTAFEPAVADRFAQITAAFDKIRDRAPAR